MERFDALAADLEEVAAYEYDVLAGVGGPSFSLSVICDITEADLVSETGEARVRKLRSAYTSLAAYLHDAAAEIDRILQADWNTHESSGGWDVT